MKLFHATNPKNVDGILKDGIKKCFGELYLSDSVEGAARWKIADVLSGNEIAVIEVSVPKGWISEGVDHSPLMQEMFKAGPSFVSSRPIPIFRIKKIHYCQFKKP